MIFEQCLEGLILIFQAVKKRTMFLADETDYSKGTEVHDWGMENHLLLLKQGRYSKFLTTSRA